MVVGAMLSRRLLMVHCQRGGPAKAWHPNTRFFNLMIGRHSAASTPGHAAFRATQGAAQIRRCRHAVEIVILNPNQRQATPS